MYKRLLNKNTKVIKINSFFSSKVEIKKLENFIKVNEDLNDGSQNNYKLILL